MKIAKTLTIAAAAMSIASLAFAAQVTHDDGEILKIDKSTATVTIKHGPPKEQANAPARSFTYDYRVPNATVVNTLQVGDKVQFVADDSGTGGKTWTVTKIDKR